MNVKTGNSSLGTAEWDPRDYLELIRSRYPSNDSLIAEIEIICEKMIEKKRAITSEESGLLISEWDAADFTNYLTSVTNALYKGHGITIDHFSHILTQDRIDPLPIALERVPYLRFRNIRIVGEVDLKGIRFPMSILFVNVQLDSISYFECIFDGNISFDESKLVACEFENCYLKKIKISSEAQIEKIKFWNIIVFEHVMIDVVRISKLVISKCKFRGSFSLRRVTCIRLANLSSNVHNGYTSFCNSEFEGTTIFIEQIFNNGTDFEGVKFRESVSFAGSQFAGRTCFKNVVFANKSNFDKVTFKNRVDFTRTEFTNRASFQSAKFELAADFGYAVFGGVPNFHDCTLHPGTIFLGTTFPKQSIFVPAGRADEYEFYRRSCHDDQHSFRTLKLLMAGHRNQHLEAKFFADELRAQREVEYRPYLRKGWRRWGKPIAWVFSWSYEKVSMYGQSVERAFLSFFVVNILFASLFVLIDRFAYPVWDQQICVIDRCLGMSRNVELFVTPKDPDKINKFVVVAGPPVALAVQNAVNPLGIFSEKTMVASQTAWVYALSLLQSVLSLSVLTLFLLALKGRFQKGSGGSTS